MTKSLRNCPGCLSDHLLVEFTIIKRETCTICHYINQGRVTPIVKGGAAILDQLIDHFINDGVNGSVLEAVLQRQLAKVQRREAKHCNHQAGKAPPREEDCE
jgi:hypothetical protein